VGAKSDRGLRHFVDGLKDEVDDLKDKTDALESEGEARDQVIDSLNETVSGLEDKTDELDSEIEALTNAITGGQPEVIDVNCDEGDLIQAAIDAAAPNATILVEGNCKENILIDKSKNGLTIDGQGLASITAAGNNGPTVSIFTRGITIINFGAKGSINGGSRGILVSETASAKIENNIIEGAKSAGIAVEGNSFATIFGNLVRKHGGNGIAILEGSAARIGSNCTAKTFNAITGNGQSGIALSRNAEASIIGNLIQGNGFNGIFVTESSMADTASNTIISNGGDGVDVRRGSSVRMGRRDTSEPGCTENPNKTFENALNDGYGIDCQSLSTVDGVLGSLNGADGSENLRDTNADCPDCCFASLIAEPPPVNEPPVADFSFTTEGLTANFTDLSEDSDGDVVAWLWDFGDGETSTEQNPSHTYSTANTYSVTLIVQDNQGTESDPASDSVEVTAPPSANVVQVFITQIQYDGNLGGLSGADAICEERAVEGGLTGTSWTAWLSDDDTDAVDRIPDGEYQLVNGTVIADDKADLIDGMLNAAINLDEFGNSKAEFAWTGTNTSGTNTGSNCQGWTDDSVEDFCQPEIPDCGDRGVSSATNADWTQLSGAPAQCNSQLSLYCFGGVE
jgi:parallel beta-helix repeat protein